ncbi:MAG: SDR family NAD(P)-dependent oxidoreductase [Anaerolineae bacterium]
MSGLTKRHRTTIGLGLGIAGGIVAARIWRQRQRARKTSPLRCAGAGRVALVTGASSGIGEAYARALARKGYALILVARREARLQALAEELSSQHNIPVEVLVADLADSAGVAKVEARIAETSALAFLVNNAGFGIRGTFVENDIASHEAMIRLHVDTTVRLTRAVLPGMLAQDCGAVVNVASFVAFFPVTGSVTYSATKAYLKSFSEALHQELAGTGVRVQALCPGFTRTEFQNTGKIDEQGIPNFAWMSAESVVEQSLRDLDNGRVISVPGAGYRLLSMLCGLIPRGLLYSMGRWTRRYRATFATPFGGFHKRTYASLADFLADVRYMLQHREQIRAAMHLIDEAFRERLMLAVTQVNACRYCSEFHAKQALKTGLSPDEVQQLLDGDVEQCPPEHLTAVLYARHWAEAAGHPDPDIHQTLVETYGAAKAAAIEMVLRMINVGNLSGNTFDSILYHISGGRLGR